MPVSKYKGVRVLGVTRGKSRRYPERDINSMLHSAPPPFLEFSKYLSYKCSSNTFNLLSSWQFCDSWKPNFQAARRRPMMVRGSQGCYSPVMKQGVYLSISIIQSIKTSLRYQILLLERSRIELCNRALERGYSFCVRES